MNVGRYNGLALQCNGAAYRLAEIQPADGLGDFRRNTHTRRQLQTIAGIVDRKVKVGVDAEMCADLGYQGSQHRIGVFSGE